jgi:hypothetical protein
MKRGWVITVSVVLGIVLVCGITLMALLQQPEAYPFVAGATVVSSQEYIENFAGGHSRLSREGVYKFDSSIQEVTALVQQSLKPPKWRQTPNLTGKEVKFENDISHVTVQSRQTGGTTVFIQEFMEPKLSDRVRMWWKRHFKK